MRLINKKTKRFIVNLFSDYILSKINKSEKSIIQVCDCINFVVVSGKSSSKDILDLQKIKEEFFKEYSSELEDANVDHMNIIDLLSYGSDFDVLEDVWISLDKNVFTSKSEPVTNLFTVSEFPYGHSLNCGRSIVYYSNYMFNHMYNLLGVNNLEFYFTKKLNSDEDFDIDIISNSNIPKEKIKSLILDVFDFDLDKFNERINNYNLFEDLLTQNKEKPYLIQDMLEHVILI
jgi:hypothetical protein